MGGYLNRPVGPHGADWYSGHFLVGRFLSRPGLDRTGRMGNGHRGSFGAEGIAGDGDRATRAACSGRVPSGDEAAEQRLAAMKLEPFRQGDGNSQDGKLSRDIGRHFAPARTQTGGLDAATQSALAARRALPAWPPRAPMRAVRPRLACASAEMELTCHALQRRLTGRIGKGRLGRRAGHGLHPCASCVEVRGIFQWPIVAIFDFASSRHGSTGVR